MRNLLPCLALATLVTTPLTTHTAEACGGGYEAARPAPQVTLVTTHTTSVGSGDKRRFGRRSFAIVGTQPAHPERLYWQRLMSTSYDPTEVARVSSFYVAHTFTLLGSTKTRVVATARAVALKHAMWTANAMFDALELPMQANDDFTIALRGDHADAVWHDLVGSYTWTSRISNTSLSITRDRGDDGTTFVVLDGKRRIGTYQGTVLGAVDVDGARYLVVTSGNGLATTISVPFA